MLILEELRYQTRLLQSPQCSGCGKHVVNMVRLRPRGPYVCQECAV